MAPIELRPTPDDPTPSVQVPGGDTYVWDPVGRYLRNVSREAEPSPVQAVRNFQTAHARYRWQVLVDDVVTRQGCHGTADDLRSVLRAVLIRELSVPVARKLQYNCWDFLEGRWVDPSTADLRTVTTGGGVMNAELQLKGGHGDLL